MADLKKLGKMPKKEAPALDIAKTLDNLIAFADAAENMVEDYEKALENANFIVESLVLVGFDQAEMRKYIKGIEGYKQMVTLVCVISAKVGVAFGSAKKIKRYPALEAVIKFLRENYDLTIDSHNRSENTARADFETITPGRVMTCFPEYVAYTHAAYGKDVLSGFTMTVGTSKINSFVTTNNLWFCYPQAGAVLYNANDIEAWKEWHTLFSISIGKKSGGTDEEAIANSKKYAQIVLSSSVLTVEQKKKVSAACIKMWVKKNGGAGAETWEHHSENLKKLLTPAK